MSIKKQNGLETEFISFLETVFKNYGLDNLSCKIMAVLYIEPTEIALDEIAKITGYSLASVSLKLKFLEKIGLVERIKKPGSKKVFYYFQKDIVKLTENKIKKAYDAEIKPVKKLLPELINKYSNLKLSKVEEEKLKIINNYYKQVLMTEKVYLKLVDFLKEEKIKFQKKE
ncbi:MAG: GbsR/MarR family transcriptional regulator [Candidatus Woesearchaeota archaeon]